MEHLPSYIAVIFMATTFLTFLLLMLTTLKAEVPNAQKKAVKIAIILLVWIGIQAVLMLQNVFSESLHKMPPKIMVFGIAPALLSILFLFVSKSGRAFVASLPLRYLTLISIVRVPVEMVLFWLFLHQGIPEYMTFSGWNFDILAGITAPLVIYFGFSKNKWNSNLLIVWNFICLVLLINIIVISVLCAPLPFQTLALEQPNMAMLYFPFSWLPNFIVPVVLFSHLASLHQLLVK